MNETDLSFQEKKITAPFVMVIFGATGDLTSSKLMPALFNLLKQGTLPDRFFVVGMARRPFTHEEFRRLMREAVYKNPNFQFPISNQAQNPKSQIDQDKVWRKFGKNLYYQQGLFEEEKPYSNLVQLLKTFDDEIGACITRFFYLATPPQNYSTILTKLDESKLDEGCGQGSSNWTRVLIEKPFGKDQENARKLEEQLATTFQERQIYRIDHYLAKETLQNILAFRFANRIFEPLWNSSHIDNIQITLFESGGIGRRGKLYEGVGALRDVFQNHIMAMIAYIAMEEPKGFNAEDIRNERVAALENLKNIDPAKVNQLVVRGQYEGYRSEKDVDPKSCTETYVAAKLEIVNPRWDGVPFYVRTGKKMRDSEVRIDIVFKNPVSKLEFAKKPNIISIRVQPREGISIKFSAKAPGLTYDLMPVEMEFAYSKSFKKTITDSYEKILIDAMLGDQTLFATSAGFGATWNLVTNIMKGWEPVEPDFPNYKAVTLGPKEADELIEKDGRNWILG